MPMSEAAMEGIRVNGSGWKLRITGLKSFTETLGQANDLNNDGEDYDQSATEAAVQGIVKKVREFAATRLVVADPEMESALMRAADDLEVAEDSDLDDINYAMNELYDQFDFYRILVN